MKDNKITRKKYRLEVLERAVEEVYSAIAGYKDSIEYCKNRLSEELNKPEEERNAWDIDRYTNDVNEYTIRTEEANKVIADLEKMGLSH